MSLPLLHSPADVVRQLLVDLGAGTDPEATQLGDWPVYADEEPDGDGIPDEVLTVYDDVASQDDGSSMIDGEAYTHHGVQVRVRARDHATGLLKAYEVRRVLNELVQLPRGGSVVTLDGVSYTVPAVRAKPVRRMGRELGKTRRHLWTVNGAAVVVRQTA